MTGLCLHKPPSIYYSNTRLVDWIPRASFQPNPESNYRISTLSTSTPVNSVLCHDKTRRGVVVSSQLHSPNEIKETKRETRNGITIKIYTNIPLQRKPTIFLLNSVLIIRPRTVFFSFMFILQKCKYFYW